MRISQRLTDAFGSVNAVGIFILIALITATFYRTLDVPFHFDDYINIVNIESLHLSSISVANLHRALDDSHLTSRAISNLSFALDWWRGNGHPQVFQQTNLFLHVINSILVLLLLRRILSTHIRPENHWVIYVVAAVWALHPIQVQSVSYIVQRMNELATIFTLLTLLLYLAGRSASGRKRLALFSLAFISFLLGALSKENAWITPALIWLVELAIVRNGDPLPRGKGWMVYYITPLVVAVFLITDIALQGPFYSRFMEPGYALRDFSLSERLLTQPRVIIFHLSQLLLPLPDRFSLEHSFRLSTALASPPDTLLALGLILIWCAIGFRLLFTRHKRFIGFILLWPLITLATESSVIPLEMVFEHRMYMPSIGIFALVGYLTLRFAHFDSHRDQYSIVVISLIILCALSLFTYQRIGIWEDKIALYEHIVKMAPDSKRTWGNLGLSHFMKGNPKEALDALNKALEISPNNIINLVNRAQVNYRLRKKYRLALNDLNIALNISPYNEHALLHRGIIYYEIGRYDYALNDFKKLRTVRPERSYVYSYIGLTLLAKENLRDAINHFKKALSINPDSGQYHAQLGAAFIKIDDLNSAKQALLKAAELGSGEEAGVHSNLAHIYWIEGEHKLYNRHIGLACQQGNDRACVR